MTKPLCSILLKRPKTPEEKQNEREAYGAMLTKGDTSFRPEARSPTLIGRHCQP